MSHRCRLLRELEWSGWEDWVGDCGFPVCPCCRGINPACAEERDVVQALKIEPSLYPDSAWKGYVLGHTPDCELAEALR